MSEDEKPLGLDLENVVFPDFRYLLTFIRRQIFVGLLIALPISLVGLWLSSQMKLIYESDTRIVYDERDRMIHTRGYSDYPRFEQLVAEFQDKITDQVFLDKVAGRLGLYNEIGEPGTLDKAIRRIKSLVGIETPPPGTLTQDEKDKIIDTLRKRILGQVYGQLFVFTVSAQWGVPEFSRQLVEQVANQFIEDGLNYEINYLDNAIATAEMALEEAELQRVTLREKLKDTIKRSIKEENRLSDREIEKLTTRIKEIQAKFVEKTAEYERLYSDKIAAENLAKVELSRVEARHKPTHPDVIRRRNELKRITNEGEVPLMRNSVETLRSELVSIRKKLAFAGVEIDEDGNVLEQRDVEFSSTAYLINLLNSYKLEKKNLEKQLLDPGQRVRFRIVKDARVPIEASNSKKRIGMMVASVIAGLALGFFMMIIREIVSPNPKDAWKIINKLKLPNFMSIESKVLKKFKLLDRETMKSMKSALAKGRLSKGGPGYSLLKYREFLQRFDDSLTGKTLLVLSTRTTKRSEFVLPNLLNVVANDTNRKLLFIDFNRNNPCVRSKGKADIFDVLDGQVELDSVVKSSDIKFLFDYVPAREASQDVAINHDALSVLLSKAKGEYDLIVLGGAQARYFVENSVLAKESSDGIVIANGRTASYEELNFMMKSVNPWEIFRGSVVVES